MKYTVLGANGFIGSALVTRLKNNGHRVLTPDKQTILEWPGPLAGTDLGHLIYCIGVTADFRSRPLDTVEAHVCVLNRILLSGGFLSLTYLSSARVYAYAQSTREDCELWATPSSLDSVYNLSKLMGESACLNGSKKGRAVRLSHVYGFDPDSENFLASVLKEAAQHGKVTIRTSPESAKDYISLEDVLDLVPRIAAQGEYGIYNLASGENMTNHELGRVLKDQGVDVHFSPRAPEWTFPRIDISKLAGDFFPPQRRLAGDLPRLLNEFRRTHE